jgi:hypothetical protein
MIFACQIEILLGVIAYYTQPDKSPFLGVIHLAVFMLLFMVFEIYYRINLGKEDKFVEDMKSLSVITSDQFTDRINAGEKLVILDDLVLDVKSF